VTQEILPLGRSSDAIGLMIYWFLPVVGLVAVATTSGTERLTAVMVTAALVAVAAVGTRAERRHALIIEGSRIGYRSGWTGRIVGWTELDQVVDVLVYPRDRHVPRMLTVVLWAQRPGKPVLRITGVPRIHDPKRARPLVKAGAVPFSIPVGALDASGRVTLRRFLARGARTSPVVPAVATWS
jgi:hypothetical protein